MRISKAIILFLTLSFFVTYQQEESPPLEESAIAEAQPQEDGTVIKEQAQSAQFDQPEPNVVAEDPANDNQEETNTSQASELRDCMNQFNQPLQIHRVLAKESCLFGQLDSEVPIRIQTALKTTLLEASRIYVPALHVKQIFPYIENQPIIKVYIQETQDQETEIVLMQKAQRFWQLRHHLNFEDDQGGEISECPGMIGGKFLGGYCKLEKQQISKHFQDIPKHKQIKLELMLHLFDNWDSELIIIQCNNEIIYQNRFANTKSSLNICGDSSYGDNINMYYICNKLYQKQD